jgi:hydroxymethylglutaryl-CoA lyase
LNTASLPKRVEIREDGPREGFQAIKTVHSTSDKLRLITALSATGVKTIEVSSFVRADKVPQLADAEGVAAGLPEEPAVRFKALYLNQQGLERAMKFPKLRCEGIVMIALSESFLKKNNNRSLREALDEIPRWIEAFRVSGIEFERLMLSTAFGDAYEGRKSVVELMDAARDAMLLSNAAGMPPKEITVADTTGWANPESVRRAVGELKAAFPETEIGLHLHDTRGTGVANAYAGLLEGVTRFDSSVGGLGGCPFAPGAAGNIASEELGFLCAELGIETGLNLDIYLECVKLAEAITGLNLPSKLKRGGLLVGGAS